MLNKYEINMKKIKIMTQDGNVNVSSEFTPAELCQEIIDKIDVVFVRRPLVRQWSFRYLRV